MHALDALLHRDRPRRRDGIHGVTHRRRDALDTLVDQTLSALDALDAEDTPSTARALAAHALEAVLTGRAPSAVEGALAWSGRGRRAPLPRDARRTVLLALGPGDRDDGPLLQLEIDTTAPLTPPALERRGNTLHGAIAPGGPKRTARAAAIAAAAIALHPPAAGAERTLAREIDDVLRGDDARPWCPDAPDLHPHLLEAALRERLPSLSDGRDVWEAALSRARRVQAILAPAVREGAALEAERWQAHRTLPATVRERLRPHDGVHLFVAPQDRILGALADAGQTFDTAFLDPPYNTGNAARAYADAQSGPGWLTAIDGAIGALRPLLPPAGLLFACIDDNEVSRLRLLLQDHGLPSLGTVVVKMSELSGVKMSHAATRLPRLKEYLLVHGRSADAALHVPRRPKDGAELRRYARYYTRVIENPEAPPEAWRLRTVPEAMRRDGLDPADPEARIAWCLAHAHRAVYRTNNARIARWRAEHPDAPSITTVDDVAGKPRIAWDDRELLRLADHLDAPVGDLWLDLSTINLHRELLGLPAYRGGQKPLSLLRRVLEMTPSPRVRVLDPWAGSGTTGHAVLEARAEGRDAHAVLIEVSPRAARLAAERLQRAAAKLNLPADAVRITACP